MDIRSRLGRISFVHIEPDVNRLNDDQRNALRHCIEAASVMTEIALEQHWSGNASLQRALVSARDSTARERERYFFMNGGPWDRFNHEEPFLPGVSSRPRGGGLYPEDLTEAEWRACLAKSPSKVAALRSPYTVVRRGTGGLTAVPYFEAYRERLERAAKELEKAAKYVGSERAARFLELRAKAFLDDDYWESELAWIDTDGNPFEITIGPYEVYADDRYGLKTMFEAHIGLPDEESTKEVAQMTDVVREVDQELSDRLGYRPRGAATPVTVVSDVFRGGEATFGRQFVAFNLPNDTKIHELKGSKKILSKTLLEAKFARVAKPVAMRRLAAEFHSLYRVRNRLLFVLAHELAHGIGPGNAETELRELYSPIEEAKADALGILVLRRLVEQRRLSQDELAGAVVGMIVDAVEEWRTSYTEAHAMASLLEFNWLREHGAIRCDRERATLHVDLDRAIAELETLAWALLDLEHRSNYKAARGFVGAWGGIPEEAHQMTSGLTDVPVAVYPVYRHNSSL